MRAATIIISNGKVLLIHRFFEGRDYYVIPGGGSEKGETAEQNALREAKEETGLDVVLGRKLWELTNPKDGRLNIYFLVEQFTGKLQLGGPESARNSATDSYVLEWHNLGEIPSMPLVPEPVKQLFIKEFCS